MVFSTSPFQSKPSNQACLLMSEMSMYPILLAASFTVSNDIRLFIASETAGLDGTSIFVSNKAYICYHLECILNVRTQEWRPSDDYLVDDDSLIVTESLPASTDRHRDRRQHRF